MINRRKVLASGVATGIAASFGGASARAVPGMRSREFKPGDVWLDTSGKPIQVRGSSIIQVGDTFFWYGENKERTTGRDRIWHWGMRHCQRNCTG